MEELLNKFESRLDKCQSRMEFKHGVFLNLPRQQKHEHGYLTVRFKNSMVHIGVWCLPAPLVVSLQ
jgi:hypothetical protein